MKPGFLSKEQILEINIAAQYQAGFHFHPVYSRDQNTACQFTFQDGIIHSLEKLLPVIAQEFAEWCGGNGWTHAGGDCWLKGGTETTTIKLYEEYQEHKTQSNATK